jgi:sugar/nucleoside kinase (ribokinase family)
MAPSFAVVGDALLDVRVTTTGPMRHGSDVPAEVHLRPGGQGSNVAVRLARRGREVSLACGIAGDETGRLIRSWLASEHVELCPVDVPATGSVVVLVDGDGERTMLSDRTPLGPSIRNAVPAADWLVVSGYLLTEPDPVPVARSLVDMAPRRILVGCAVPDEGLDAWRDAAAALSPDLLILNADEARRLGMRDMDGVIVTRRDGASGRLDGLVAAVEAEHGTSSTDSTGAGDALAAVLVARLAEQWPATAATFEAALREAVEAGAAVARVSGAQAVISGERVAGRPA